MTNILNDPARVLAIAGSLIVRGPTTACPPILEVVLPDTGNQRVYIKADLVDDVLLPMAAAVVALERGAPDLHAIIAGLKRSNEQLIQDKAVLVEAIRAVVEKR